MFSRISISGSGRYLARAYGQKNTYIRTHAHTHTRIKVRWYVRSNTRRRDARRRSPIYFAGVKASSRIDRYRSTGVSKIRPTVGRREIDSSGESVADAAVIDATRRSRTCVKKHAAPPGKPQRESHFFVVLTAFLPRPKPTDNLVLPCPDGKWNKGRGKRD